jgi:hypothetical protein
VVLLLLLGPGTIITLDPTFGSFYLIKTGFVVVVFFGVVLQLLNLAES